MMRPLKSKHSLSLIIFISALFLWCARLILADIPAERKANQATMRKLVQALERSDSKAVSQLIRYPLPREKPLKDLRGPEDFLAHYDEFIDAAASKAIIRGIRKDLSQKNIRGTGKVFFGEGKVIEIEPAGAVYKGKLAAAKKQDNLTLHPSAQRYDELLMDCVGKRKHVRAERFGTNYVLFIWEKNSPTTSPPERLDNLIRSYDLSKTVGSLVYSISPAGWECYGENWNKATGECFGAFDLTKETGTGDDKTEIKIEHDICPSS